LTSSASLKISGSTFKENNATNRGGAVFTKNILFMMDNSNLISNIAMNGGAVFCIANKTGKVFFHKKSIIPKDSDINLSIINNQFYSNLASNAGGAMRLIVDNLPLDMSGNTFVNNIAIGSPNDNNVLIKNPTEIIINLYNITKYYESPKETNIHLFVENMKKTNGLV